MMDNGQRDSRQRGKKTPVDMRNHCPKGDTSLRRDLFESGSLGGFNDGLLTYRVGAH